MVLDEAEEEFYDPVIAGQNTGQTTHVLARLCHHQRLFTKPPTNQAAYNQIHFEKHQGMLYLNITLNLFKFFRGQRYGTAAIVTLPDDIEHARYSLASYLLI